MHDIVIRNALIVDGTGAPARRGDVAIDGERIVAVGLVEKPGREEIDASGLMLTPGFVDIHTHYDGQASWDTLLAPSSINGVTSVAMGNCGVGFAPARPGDHARLIELLEGVEDIPGTALHEGLTWDWESFPDYLDALERRSFAIDVGAQLPHSALRVYVMGERGCDPDEEPTATELESMEELADEAMAAGALGITTSRTVVHRSKNGEVIGTLRARSAELAVLARALRTAGTGVFQLISDAYASPDDAFVEDELDLVEQVAEASGRPVSVTVMQPRNLPDRWRTLFARAESLSAKGHDVRTQVAPRPVGLIMSFATTVNPFFLTETWKSLRDLPLNERLARLALAECREALIAEHRARMEHGPTVGPENEFDYMFRMQYPVDYEPQYENSIAAEAQRLGKDVLEHVYDVLLEDGGRRTLYFPAMNFAAGNLDAVHEMLSSKHALYSLSDGGAHCGTICDGSFPSTAIELWPRGSKTGKSIPLEQVVHCYSQRNAAYLGWLDRGVIAPGYLADINIIRQDELGLEAPEIAEDLPAGGVRLLQSSRGFKVTIKRGKVTFRGGRPTGELPGRLVRGEQRLQAS
jgi:N-acyl-D-amino-acid deacylase